MESGLNIAKAGDVERNAAPMMGRTDSLSSEARTILFETGQPREYLPDRRLFQQGFSPEEVFLIDQGLVKLLRLEQEGREMIVGLRFPGSILGAASAIVQKPHPVSAVSLTGCRLRRMAWDDFLDLAKNDPTLNWYLHFVHSSEMYDQVEQIAGMRHLSARQRLEQLLWNLIFAIEPKHTRMPLELHLPLKYREIAQLIGITPEHLSRVLRRIEDEGAMRRENGTLTIFDRRAFYHSTDS